MYKQHHSLGDGVSIMNYHIGQGDTFDMEALIPIRTVPFFKRMLIRLSFLFYVPRLALKFLKIKSGTNALHDGERKLSGRKVAGTSSDILFKDIKAASKYLGITINDLITACLSTALKQYLELKGDKATEAINIVIPANIRFQHYGSWERVKFENKFTAVPLRLPLNKDLKKSLEVIPHVTRHIRDEFIDIYATYAITYYYSMFAPYFFQNWAMKNSTKAFTLAFSNTPGLLKALTFEKTKKSIKNQFYFVPSAHTGMGLSCMSYVDYFKITLTADDSIMKDPQTLLDLLETNIKACYVGETPPSK